MRYPAAPLTVALLTGAAAGLFVPADADALAACVWIGWALALMAYVCREPLTCAAASLITTALCGWGLAHAANRHAMSPDVRAILRQATGTIDFGDRAPDLVLVTGRLEEDAAPLDEGARLLVALDSIAIDGRTHHCRSRVLLTVAGQVPAGAAVEWRRGRRIRAPALLRRPARYLNAGVPDHELALLRRGLALVGTIKSAALVEVVRDGGWLDERAAAVRAFVRRVIDREVGRHSARSAAIVRAIVIGDRTGLDATTEERLQAAGTYHVLAISGGNIAILAGLLLLGLRLLAVRPPASDIAAAAMLVAYAWLVGGGASVIRATSMAVTLLAAHAVDHRSPPRNALCLSAAWGMALSPLGLFDPGAWLSYGATFAILTAAASAPAWLAGAPFWVQAAVGVLVASLAAEAALFPVSAFVFSRATAAGLLLNFAAVPLMTFVQVGAVGTLAASSLAPAAAWAGHTTHLAAWALVESARLVELVPWLARRLPPPDVWWLAAYYAGWAAVLGAPAWSRSAAVRNRQRLAGAAVVLCAGIWILAAPPPVRTGPRDVLRVTFLDVGQGDATLVHCPDGTAVLVDAGGAGGSRFDIGRRVIEPAIWATGVRRLHYLVVSHGDADHMNGATAIVRDIPPREVWEGIPVPPHEPLRLLRQAVSGAGAGWRVVQRGDQLQAGEVKFVVHHPALGQWERHRVRNDDSVVIEVRYRDVSIVLTGDVEAPGEREMLPSFEPAALRVMKAPHHGSASSSNAEILAALRPAAVVVSAGRGNRFGHPSPLTLRRYAAAGAAVLRTDRDGAIVLQTDGRFARLRTYTGRTLSLSPASPPHAR